MQIIIIDHYSKSIFSSYYSRSQKYFLTRLFAGAQARAAARELEYNLTMRNAGSLASYTRKPLTQGYWYQVPATTAIVERSINLFYIEIVGDILQLVE